MSQKHPRFFDLSPEITEDLAVWPGDQPFERKKQIDFEQGDNLRLSSIRCTLHLGAHADAPNHYHPEGKGIESRSLDFYYGPCQIIEVLKAPHSRIVPQDILGIPIRAPRILFRTLSYPRPNQWQGDFVALSAALIHFLADQGVILVGIDTPSIDLSNDRFLETHQAVYTRNLAVLEGIVLDAIPTEPLYTLIALPLKIRDADASPVRAMLVAPEPPSLS
jgi:arylformamidase